MTEPDTRSIVYIDGFNLYYGMLKGTRHKWLDIQRLFETLRQDDDVQLIRYFTARVVGGTQLNQLTYLRALATCPKVEIIQGRFKNKQVCCRVEACHYSGRRFFSMPEEKRTDVNIAISLLDDAYQDAAERFVLVSGDSDLVPAVARLKRRFPKKQVITYVPALDPTRGAAVELRGASDKDKTLPLALVKKCQFPPELDDGAGGMIVRPGTW